MKWLSNLVFRFISRKQRFDELSGSIHEHLEERADELVEQGMPRDKALQTAKREFGNVALLEQRSREVWQWPTFESTWEDIRFAVRQIRKSPGFAITVCLTFAIGIGANTAVFSMMDAMILRPLAVPDMSRMVAIYEFQNQSADSRQVALGNFNDWARESRSFEGLALRGHRTMDLTDSGEAAHVDIAIVSPNFFPLLRAEPLMGRLFRDDEAMPGKDGEGILSYGFWKRHFAGNPNILGQQVELDGRSVTIIGVLPRTLAYPATAELYLPVAATPQDNQNRRSHEYGVVGRLRDGVTLSEAQAELHTIALGLEKRYPDTNKGWSVQVQTLLQDINGTMTPLYFKMIMGATAFVLLIVCANVANLQFARGLARRNEMAIRTALGAGRIRLLRQLLAESVMLGVAGAAAGLILAKLDLQVAIYFMPQRIARYISGWGHLGINGRALALSITLAIVAGIVAGLGPALVAMRVNLNDQLKADGRTGTGSKQSHRLRSIFAVAQIALAVALVICSALMAKGMWNMLHTNEASNPDRILTFNIGLPKDRYATPEKQAQWFEQSLDRLRALPGIQQAAVTTGLPSGDEGTWNDDFQIEGRPLRPGQDQSVSRFAASPDYFSTMKIRVEEGRAFMSGDTLGSSPVAVVSRNFAQHYFANSTPIGHRIRLGSARGGSEPWLTIVGVVEDVRYEWADAGPEISVFVDALQSPPTEAHYVVRTAGEALNAASTVRQTIASLDPRLPADAMQSYAGYLRESLTGLLFAGSNMIVDAAIALLLAAVGIFGVMANLVGERRREIGVRLTMGATRKNVLGLFLGRAGILTGVGLSVGVAMAAGLARLISNLLYGVQPGDLLVFSVAIAAITAVALASAYLPARKAALTDPIVALRNE